MSFSVFYIQMAFTNWFDISNLAYIMSNILDFFVFGI